MVYVHVEVVNLMKNVVEDNKEEVLKIIDQCSKAREQYVSAPLHLDMGLDSAVNLPVKVEVGGATVFVLPIESFHQF